MTYFTTSSKFNLIDVIHFHSFIHFSFLGKIKFYMHISTLLQSYKICIAICILLCLSILWCFNHLYDIS